MASKNKIKLNNNDMSMKIILAAALLITFIGGYLIARARYKPQIKELTNLVSSKDVELQKLKNASNKVFMKDGKMWMVEGGLVKPMENDIMMPNGLKIIVDGKAVEKGEEKMLENGDAYNMEGQELPNEESNVDTSVVGN